MVQKWTGESRSNFFFQNMLIFFVKYGGRHCSYFIGFFIAVFYAVLPSVRKNASFYLKRRFLQTNKIKLFIHTYRLNYSLAKILIDKTVFGIRGDIDIVSSNADKQLCKDLFAKGKGLVIITAHCGCWQMAMSAFDFMEGDKYVVYHRNAKDIDKHAYELSGKLSPVKFIDPAGYAGGSLEIMLALQKKAIVCIMGDRIYGDGKENTVQANFLGDKIKTHFSIYRIAAWLGAPIAIVLFPYKGNGKVDSEIFDVFFVKDKGKFKNNYLTDVERFIKSLENFTKKYPYQFFNYFNIWE
jgi:predicted LPLAT superfamily acyltransferase